MVSGIPTRRSDYIGRQAMVLSNLATGRFGAAARAEFAPDELSLEEAKLLSARLGLNKGVFGVIFDTVTNPIVLIGAALSLVFPLASAKNVFKVRKLIENTRLDSFFPMWARKFAHDPVSMFSNIVGRKGMPKHLEKYVGKPLISDALIDQGGFKRAFVIKHVEEGLGEARAAFQKVAGRNPSLVEERLVVASLDGQLKRGTPRSWRHFRDPETKAKVVTPFDVKTANKHIDDNPALRQLIKDYRKVLDGTRDEMMLADPVMNAEIRRAMVKQAKSEGRTMSAKAKRLLETGEGQIPNEIRSAVVRSKAYKTRIKELQKTGQIQPGESIEDYWVHTMSDVNAQFARDMDSTLLAVGGDEKLFGKLAGGGVAAQVSKNLRKRMGRMLPDPEDYTVLEGTGLLDEAAGGSYEKFKGTWESIVRRAQKDGAEVVIPYTMDLNQGTVSYMNRMANTYSMNKANVGSRVEEGMKILREIKDTERLSVLQNTVLPLMMGKQDFTRASKSMYMAGLQRKIGQMLDAPGIRDLKPIKWMKERLQQNSKWIAGLESEMTGLLYSGALGLPNVASPALNALQTFLTTIPLMGAAHALKGFSQVAKRVPKYLRLRFDKRLGHMPAMKQVFPDFVEEGFGGTFRITDEGLDLAFRRAQRSAFGKKYDRIQDGTMEVFEKTEVMNQLTAFYGGRSWARASGIKVEEDVRRFAAEVVNRTQFPGSLANTIIGITQIKGAAGGRLITMFSQFGAKYAQFLGRTALTAGAAEKAVFRLNPGTLGRAMLTSGLVYEMGQAVGKDMSRALFTGALPEAFPDAPFYPLPVSPAVGLMGSLFTEKEDTARMLPLLVPGGVGLSRVAGLVSEGLATTIGRRFVDWEHSNDDGTYKVFSPGRGGTPPTLVGNFTPLQLLMDSLGLPGGGIAQREAEAAQWLLKQRARILGYKQQYMDSVDQSRMQDATAIDREFQAAYPEVKGGVKSLIKPGDWDGIFIRRNVLRLEKIMDTMPPNVRPMMAAAIQQMLMQMAPDLLGQGLEPQSLSTSSTYRKRRGLGNQRGTAGGGNRGRRSVFGRSFQGTQGFQRNRGGYGLSSSSKTPESRNIARHDLPNVTGY